MKQFFLFLLVFYSLHCFAQTDSLASKFPIDSGYIHSFDNIKIAYETRGNGKPVLLVHGFIANSTSWKHTALYYDLLNAGYKVITVDLRGNGKSDKPHDSLAYDNDAEAKDVMLLMDSLHVDNYACIGYSRGSIITARLLVLDKRIKAAVMGGMGTDFTNPEWPRRIMFYHALRGDSVPQLAAMVTNVKKQGLDVLALSYMQRSQPSTSKEALHNLVQPVLVISGSEDEDNGKAKDLADVLQHSTLATVSGDHGHAYSTTEFSAAILSFLQKND